MQGTSQTEIALRAGTERPISPNNNTPNSAARPAAFSRGIAPVGHRNFLCWSSTGGGTCHADHPDHSVLCPIQHDEQGGARVPPANIRGADVGLALGDLAA